LLAGELRTNTLRSLSICVPDSSRPPAELPDGDETQQVDAVVHEVQRAFPQASAEQVEVIVLELPTAR
jgi:hypothetical protein